MSADLQVGDIVLHPNRVGFFRVNFLRGDGYATIKKVGTKQAKMRRENSSYGSLQRVSDLVLAIPAIEDLQARLNSLENVGI